MLNKVSLKLQFAIMLSLIYILLGFFLFNFIKDKNLEKKEISESIEIIKNSDLISELLINITDERNLIAENIITNGNTTSIIEARINTNSSLQKLKSITAFSTIYKDISDDYAQLTNTVDKNNTKSSFKIISLYQPLIENISNHFTKYAFYINYNEATTLFDSQISLLNVKRQFSLFSSVNLINENTTNEELANYKNLYDVTFKKLAVSSIYLNRNNLSNPSFSNEEIEKLIKNEDFLNFVTTSEDYSSNKFDFLNQNKQKVKDLHKLISKIEDEHQLATVNFLNDQYDIISKNIIITTTSAFVLLILSLILAIYIFSNTINAIKKLIKISENLAIGKIDSKFKAYGFKELATLVPSFHKMINGQILVNDLATNINQGNYGHTIPTRSNDDIVIQSLNEMSENLKTLKETEENQRWVDENQLMLIEQLSGIQNHNECSTVVSNFIAEKINCCSIALFLNNKNKTLSLIGGYALPENTEDIIKHGIGLVGQTAVSRKSQVLNSCEAENTILKSAFLNEQKLNVLVYPIIYRDEVMAVIELAKITPFSNKELQFLDQALSSIGSYIDTINQNKEMMVLIEKLTLQAEELQTQEEELRQNNAELEKQTQQLLQSEEELKTQQAELELSNIQVEEKAIQLEERNQALLQTQEAIKLKAAELENSNRFKSEFLANMSHELRTPLNSIMLLSELIKENKPGNLLAKQVEQIEVINSSGRDLLNLINDILDLAKIESGKVELNYEDSSTDSVLTSLKNTFTALADKKGVNLLFNKSENFPKSFHTDQLRLEQILKNLISNALKFTAKNGTVSVDFKLSDNQQAYKFEISDTGIGIPAEKLQQIFEAFQQADGSTSRKYGGTGLGLSISKELTALFNGTIEVDSVLNEGSKFTLTIPVDSATEKKIEKSTVTEQLSKITSNNGHTSEIEIFPEPEPFRIIDIPQKENRENPLLLIIEDDKTFANTIAEQADEYGFETQCAYDGLIGYELIVNTNPDAIILDMNLPGLDGWTILKRIKENKTLSKIPVHIVSGMDKEDIKIDWNKFDFSHKPLSVNEFNKIFEVIRKKIKSVHKTFLIIEDDVNLNQSITDLIKNADKNFLTISASSFSEAADIVKENFIDCAIVDLGLPDANNIEIVNKIKNISLNKSLYTIVFTGKELTKIEQTEIQQNANSLIVKEGNSSERIKDEISLFINKVSKQKESKSKTAFPSQQNLKGTKILMVDDDMRNIFALTELLESNECIITTKFNGKEAVDELSENTDFDIILMDIMMPEMDGFEAMEIIRSKKKLKNIPIIALTAKAMKEDRENCLKAGASDYISKPIDTAVLLNKISLWTKK